MHEGLSEYNAGIIIYVCMYKPVHLFACTYSFVHSDIHAYLHKYECMYVCINVWMHISVGLL